MIQIISIFFRIRRETKKKRRKAQSTIPHSLQLFVLVFKTRGFFFTLLAVVCCTIPNFNGFSAVPSRCRCSVGVIVSLFVVKFCFSSHTPDTTIYPVASIHTSVASYVDVFLPLDAITQAKPLCDRGSCVVFVCIGFVVFHQVTI